MKYIVLILYGWLLSTSAWAVVDIHKFDTESQRQRYLVLIDELRCPKCQNQNLSGSDAEIATDLRRELHRLLLEGKTDREIILFMVNRYGDFILYRPKLQANTWFLWFAPVVLFLLGVIVLWKITHRRRDLASEPEALTQAEEITLKQLLIDNTAANMHNDKKSTTGKNKQR